MRYDGRNAAQIRPIKFTPNFTQNSLSSVLVEMGQTVVLCTVNFEESYPSWMRGSSLPKSWLTAEYSMLPGSTHTRSKRERPNVSGRTQEIQRLIGRSLRGIMDFSKCPESSFLIDCDVLQADGGTRTASINGAYFALSHAVHKLMQQGKLKANPLKEAIAAISVGISGESFLADLNYQEDSKVDLDMNIVMTESLKLIEIQGSAEKQHFSKTQVIEIINIAEESLKTVFVEQKKVCP